MRLAQALTATLVLAASCAGHVEQHPGVLPERELPPPALSALPPDLRAIAGFDETVRSGEDGWLRGGHSLLYRVHLHVGDTEREWFVAMRLISDRGRSGSFQVTPEGAAPREYRVELLPVAVELIEVGNDERSISNVWLPRSSMDHSLHTTSRRFEELKATGERLVDLDPGAQRELSLGNLGAVTLLSAWQGDPALAGVLKKVVGVPVSALIGVMLEGGITYSVEASLSGDTDVEVELPPPVGLLDGRRIPLNVLLGGATIMHVELEAVETAAPFNVGAGIARLRGAHPTDAQRWVEVELIGARLAR